jgi:hypothetical protein
MSPGLAEVTAGGSVRTLQPVKREMATCLRSGTVPDCLAGRNAGTAIDDAEGVMRRIVEAALVGVA